MLLVKSGLAKGANWADMVLNITNKGGSTI